MVFNTIFFQSAKSGEPGIDKQAVKFSKSNYLFADIIDVAVDLSEEEFQKSSATAGNESQYLAFAFDIGKGLPSEAVEFYNSVLRIFPKMAGKSELGNGNGSMKSESVILKKEDLNAFLAPLFDELSPINVAPKQDASVPVSLFEVAGTLVLEKAESANLVLALDQHGGDDRLIIINPLSKADQKKIFPGAPASEEYYLISLVPSPVAIEETPSIAELVHGFALPFDMESVQDFTVEGDAKVLHNPYSDNPTNEEKQISELLTVFNATASIPVYAYNIIKNTSVTDVDAALSKSWGENVVPSPAVDQKTVQIQNNLKQLLAELFAPAKGDVNQTNSGIVAGTSLVMKTQEVMTLLEGLIRGGELTLVGSEGKLNGNDLISNLRYLSYSDGGEHQKIISIQPINIKAAGDTESFEVKFYTLTGNQDVEAAVAKLKPANVNDAPVSVPLPEKVETGKQSDVPLHAQRTTQTDIKLVQSITHQVREQLAALNQITKAEGSATRKAYPIVWKDQDTTTYSDSKVVDVDKMLSDFFASEKNAKMVFPTGKQQLTERVTIDPKVELAEDTIKVDGKAPIIKEGQDASVKAGNESSILKSDPDIKSVPNPVKPEISGKVNIELESDAGTGKPAIIDNTKNIIEKGADLKSVIQNKGDVDVPKIDTAPEKQPVTLKEDPATGLKSKDDPVLVSSSLSEKGVRVDQVPDGKSLDKVVNAPHDTKVFSQVNTEPLKIETAIQNTLSEEIKSPIKTERPDSNTLLISHVEAEEMPIVKEKVAELVAGKDSTVILSIKKTDTGTLAALPDKQEVARLTDEKHGTHVSKKVTIDDVTVRTTNQDNVSKPTTTVNELITISGKPDDIQKALTEFSKLSQQPTDINGKPIQQTTVIDTFRVKETTETNILYKENRNTSGNQETMGTRPIKDEASANISKTVVLINEAESVDSEANKILDIPLSQKTSVLEPKVVEPKVVEPKVVEPKVVEPKVVEPKVLEPKVLEPKVVEPKVVEPKVLEPKVLEPKVLEPKVLEPKVLEPKVLEPKVVEPKVVEPKVVEPKVVEPKVVESKVLEPKVLEPKVLEPKVLEPKVVEPEQVLTRSYEKSLDGTVNQTLQKAVTVAVKIAQIIDAVVKQSDEKPIMVAANTEEYGDVIITSEKKDGYQDVEVVISNPVLKKLVTQLLGNKNEEVSSSVTADKEVQALSGQPQGKKEVRDTATVKSDPDIDSTEPIIVKKRSVPVSEEKTLYDDMVTFVKVKSQVHNISGGGKVDEMMYAEAAENRPVIEMRSVKNNQPDTDSTDADETQTFLHNTSTMKPLPDYTQQHQSGDNTRQGMASHGQTYTGQSEYAESGSFASDMNQIAGAARVAMKPGVPVSTEKVVRDTEVFKEVSRYIARREKSEMILRVEPENLGKVKIRLIMQQDQMRAQIEVESDTVKRMLESNLPQLFRDASQAGVQLGAVQISLSQQEPRQTKQGSTRKKSAGKVADAALDENKELKTQKRMGYNTYEYLA